MRAWFGGRRKQKHHSQASRGVCHHAGHRNLLARWPVAWGGRTLGMIGRDRAALVREDWIGRNEPLPVRTKTEAAASSPLAPVLSDCMAGTTKGRLHSQLGPWKLSQGDTTEHSKTVLTWGSQRSNGPPMRRKLWHP